MKMPNDDLEQVCEDALFELCDVRERYPAKCADKLEQSFHLIRRINSKPPKKNIIEKLDEILITDEQKILLQNVEIIDREKYKSWKRRDKQLDRMLTNIDDLRTVMEQIKNEEVCPINSVINGK